MSMREEHSLPRFTRYPPKKSTCLVLEQAQDKRKNSGIIIKLQGEKDLWCFFKKKEICIFGHDVSLYDNTVEERKEKEQINKKRDQHFQALPPRSFDLSNMRIPAEIL
jgi:hypothetical protein